MLEAFNIDVFFNPNTPLQNHAIRSLSIKIDQGEFVTVIGSNGAGKSTLLGVFAGDVRPTSGLVRIDRKDVTQEEPYRRARRIGRVFQDPRAGTCENMTILENLAVASARLRARGLRSSTPKAAIGLWRERLSELRLGLEERLHDKVGLLSGGQRQALSLLMACFVPNRALLLDEHTAALDPNAAENILRLTNEFASRDGLTVLMVTHSMSQALAHGTRTLMLHEGRVLFGLPHEQKRSMSVSDLQSLFQQVRGQTADEDAMVLG